MSVPGITSSLVARDPESSRPPAASHAVRVPASRSEKPLGAVAGDSPPGGAPRQTQDVLLQAVEELKAVIEPVARELRFSIDQDVGRTVVKVVDTKTEQVIRQFPSEEMLAITKAIDKAIDKLKGVMVNNLV